MERRRLKNRVGEEKRGSEWFRSLRPRPAAKHGKYLFLRSLSPSTFSISQVLSSLFPLCSRIIISKYVAHFTGYNYNNIGRLVRGQGKWPSHSFDHWSTTKITLVFLKMTGECADTHASHGRLGSRAPHTLLLQNLNNPIHSTTQDFDMCTGDQTIHPS